MEIMFDDLTPQAQERLLEEAGISDPEDMNWDEIPVAIVELSEVKDEFEENDFSESIYDYGYDEDEMLD
jgi:ABC-type glycerol-3-phosphate transport system substrate-binding protein